METLILILLIGQAIGAIVGAGGAVMGELAYFRAIRDGRIDRAERDHLRAIAAALRFGMFLLLIFSIALVLTDFAYSLPFQPAQTAAYWSLMTFALIVIWASWALSRRRVPFWLGSATVFTGWWMMALLSLGRLPAMSYGATLLFALVAGCIIAAFFGYARSLYPRGLEPREL